MQKPFDDILNGIEGPVLLAVSGGMDSMCMASLFYNSQSGLPFAVAHCNFHLRGEESDADERLVLDWAHERGIKVYRKDFNTEEYSSSHAVSIEMAARDLRYAWFAELCRTEGFRSLAVAHNANDNAETLFLNLLRGTGMKGMTAMGEKSVIPSPEGGLYNLYRPLLGFTRKMIEGYVRENKVPYRDDRTNFQTDYKRNKIRNMVFPVFEQINPSFVKTITREIALFADIEGILDEFVKSHRESCLSESDGIWHVDIAALKAAPHSGYVLYSILSGFGFNSAAISSAKALLDADTRSGKVFHSQDYRLVSTTSEFLIEPVREQNFTGLTGRRLFGAPKYDDAVMVVRGEGTYHFNGKSFTVCVVPRHELTVLKMGRGTIAFDISKLDFPIVCRRWNDGDWFRPFGMRGKKKVSDFFTDLKYSLIDKESSVVLPFLGDDNHIAAVLGERIDDSLKITDSTEKVIIMKVI